MVLSSVRSISLREQVVEQIRMAIIEGRLKPGDHITEAVLTSQLGVSRTPVREALILLEREGLVVSSPNRGSFVRAFTTKDVSEIFSLRTTLENFAGQLIINKLSADDLKQLRNSIAAQNAALQEGDFKKVRTIDMNFHQYLVSASGHEMLTRNWREIVAQIAAVLYLRADAIEDYDEYQSLKDHAAIVAAYETRDYQKLTQLNEQINQRVAAECQRAIRANATS
jgi:DNA-binding GntR family transcriptional regulator